MQAKGQRRVLALMMGVFLAGAGGAGAQSEPFDHQHSTLAKVLQLHVKDGLVDYRALSENPGDLNRYLDQLAAVPERTFQSWVIPQRLAFLINLHNATVLKMVADRYPIPSFQRVSGLFRDPWEQPTVRVFGANITLAILRDNMLRRHYAEPAIHFALVPAALGAPMLRAEPYTPDRLYEQLEDQGRAYLNDFRRNRIDRTGNRLTLSPVFRWYNEDFVKRAGSLEAYVKPYLSAELGSRDFSIRYGSYDWALNDQHPTSP